MPVVYPSFQVMPIPHAPTSFDGNLEHASRTWRV